MDKKKEKTKEEIMKNMDESDWERIREYQELSKLKPGTLRYRLFIENDNLLRQFREKKLAVERSVWQVRNAEVARKKKLIQLTSGSITETNKDGSPMTEEELKLDVEQARWLQEAYVKDICQELVNLSVFVCRKGFLGDEILTKQDFEKFVNKVEADLLSIGLTLFDYTKNYKVKSEQ